MKIEIKCRFSGSVLFTHEADKNSLKITVEAAIASGANLAGASLGGANLDGASLGGAYLARANLDGANLAGASLGGAYLAGANLDGANLDGEVLTKAPMSLLNLRWHVIITAQFMRIGCQRHDHASWRRFTDDEIGSMDAKALRFWVQWKGPLLAMCDAYHEDTPGEVVKDSA